MLEEILLRLSVKSLLRLSRVCKVWHALITSPKCNKKLLSQNRMNMVVSTNHCVPQILDYEALLYPPQNNNNHDVVYDEGSEFGAIPLRGANNEDFSTKLSSCNGLVCVEFFHYKKNVIEVYLWNPSTRSYRNISTSRPRTASKTYFSSSLSVSDMIIPLMIAKY